jgi:methyl-accepting chemotaxis protein
MRLSVRTKLLGMAGILLALTLLIGAISIKSLAAVNEKGGSMYADRVVPIRDLAEVRALLGDIDSQIQRAITDTKGDDAKYADTAAKDTQAIDDLVKAYEATFLVDAEKQGLRSFHDAWNRYQESFGALLDHTSRGDDAAAVRVYYARAAFEYAEVDGDVAELIQINDTVAKGLNEDIAAAYSGSRTLVIALIVLALAVGAAISIALSRSISRAVAALVARLKSLNEQDLSSLDGALAAMSAGDLTVEATPVTEPIESYPGDEIGQASQTTNELIEKTRGSLRSYNEMRANLSDVIGQVSQSAESLSASSQQIASTSDEAGRAVSEIAGAVGEVAQGAERQVRMVESARGAVQEAARAANASAETAQSTAQAADQARRVAGDGVQAAEHASDAMRAVSASSQQVATAIEELSTRSQRIGGIVDTITGIAEQTNLLALNAAIEAARAGEQGRGFAVVAEEVRKLAEESQDAAGQIAGLVGEIQSETDKAVSVVADGAQRTEDGVATVARTREAFEAIGAAVEDMSARVGEIATAVEQISSEAERAEANVAEVASVAEQSSASAEQVSASTQQTSASTQEIAASAQSLASTAEQLNDLVRRFTLTA